MTSSQKLNSADSFYKEGSRNSLRPQTMTIPSKCFFVVVMDFQLPCLASSFPVFLGVNYQIASFQEHVPHGRTA